MNKSIITVALADDYILLRKGIAELINKFEGVHVIIQANNGNDLLAQFSKTKNLPDITVLDYSMPEMNGYDTLVEIKKLFPKMKVLALSMYDSEYNIIKMLSAGSGGYLPKDCEPVDLETAIRSIYAHGVYYSKDVPKELFESAKDKILPNLTDREIEFLKLCCQSLTNKEIADKMGISPRTVDNYRDSLGIKLKVKNRVDLAMFAIRSGIVPI